MAPKKRGLDPGAAARIGGNRNAGSASNGSTTATATGPATTPDVPAPAAPAGILGALSAAAEQPVQPGERILDIPVGEIAPHPENLRPIGDVTELGQSIAEQGLYQPLIVITRGAFLARKPEHPLHEQVRYVLIDGHQRHAGAVEANVAVLPAVVRDHLAGDEDTVVSMLITGLMRIGVTPMQEARGFARLQASGWSERRISEKTKFSPGQVHKRLSLNRLPEKVVAELEAGQLSVSAALTLLKLPDEDIAAAWAQAKREEWRGVDGVVTSRLATMAAREQAEHLRAALTAAGVPLIEDPETEYGPGHWHHRLPHDSYAVPGADLAVRGISTDGATPPADVVAYVHSNGGRLHLEWHSTEPRSYDDPVPEPSSPGTGTAAAGPAVGAAPGASAGSTPATAAPGTDTAVAGRELEQERDRQVQERRRRAEAARVVADARAAACKRIATGRLDPELAVEILADVLLVDVAVEPYNVAGLAAEFCGVPIVEDDPLVSDDVDNDADAVSVWLATQAQAGPLPARRAAVAIALAEVEDTIAGNDRNPGALWTGLQVRHVRRLAAHGGYELTPDDKQRVADILGTALPSTSTTSLDTDPGASAGSTPADGATS